MLPKDTALCRAETGQLRATNRAMTSCTRLFRTDAKKRPERGAISASANRRSKRNSDGIHRFGVRLKRMVVLSLRRERTLNTLRFNLWASSASLIVPNKASSAGIQARRFSQHCGMFKEWRFNCTANRVRPNIRATTASGLLPSSSISRLDQRMRCGEKIGMSRDSLFAATAPGVRRRSFANSSSRMRPTRRSSWSVHLSEGEPPERRRQCRFSRR